MNFIECTEKQTNIKVLIPFNKVLSISQSPDDLTAFIETHIDINGDGVGFYIKETFDEIKAQLVDINEVLNFY